jgi:predicted nucleotidyltransferase
MENWEQAARHFIEQCDFSREIDAVFLTGSYAAGNADAFSDIDLYIVLNERATYRERGTKRIDGFLVEYFANPVRQIKKYIDSSYGNANMIEINMILNGTVLMDKNSAAEELRAYCREKDIRNFPAADEGYSKMSLYLLWDALDELTRASECKSTDFMMQYYAFVLQAFNFYSRYIRSPIPNNYHLFKWLDDEKYFNRYGLPAHGDPVFSNLVLNALKCTDASFCFDQAGIIYHYIADKLGGLDADNFSMRSEIGF